MKNLHHSLQNGTIVKSNISSKTVQIGRQRNWKFIINWESVRPLPTNSPMSFTFQLSSAFRLVNSGKTEHCWETVGQKKMKMIKMKNQNRKTNGKNYRKTKLNGFWGAVGLSDQSAASWRTKWSNGTKTFL